MDVYTATRIIENAILQIRREVDADAELRITILPNGRWQAVLQEPGAADPHCEADGARIDTALIRLARILQDD